MREENDASGGNTLDRWAGYAPNPEDTARLLEAIESTSGAVTLVREVGSGVGSGEPMVFDLDGNVAEWAVDESDTGVLVGPSADRPSSKLHRSRDAGEAYRGFRVVIGEIANDEE